ncbi:polyketide synthase PksN [Pseudoduganella flava]|uniref:Polyketide synthase PksN n=1 Tax=Pseudoduganella flava TaxID=871742 RepID=A0A562PHU2_9BURK|nr:SDR family NAD(P)-dependent oxidoreductase [Pseudoduganella flava]QGZ37638.1 SDR family NAD(P)-dependent oxidoreductase [Pseudoduganella flava]TWI43999.1 polyketide synthase PksN [Pseudoduganella flava]
MIDFVAYVVSELKRKNLSKTDALGLIRQYSAGPAQPGAVLHPLVHRNTSDLAQQSYATSFSGDEFFLRDHRVQGRKVLPAVAYLEMARAAVEMALPPGAAGTVLELRNVAWVQPIVFPDQRDVTVALFKDEAIGNRVEFEVVAGDSVHCQGAAVVCAPQAAPRHDLAALAARMNQGRTTGADLYRTIAGLGIDLGPAHQGVRAVQRGAAELLVEIVLPAALEGERDRYRLHPSMLDSAIQAAMGLVMEDGAGAPLPFALETLRVFGGCERRMFAWVRRAGAGERIVKLDIDLCDEAGDVRVQMLGFSARAVADADAAPATGCLMAVPRWQATAAAGQGSAQRHVIVCDLPQVEVAALGCDAVALDTPSAERSDERYTALALACLDKLHTVLSANGADALVQVVVPDDAEHMPFAGIAGMLGTAAQENPRVAAQLLWVPADIATPDLSPLLAQESGADLVVRYVDNTRQVLRWEALAGTAPLPAWKDHGIYLITGGFGGIGQLFAREILAQTSAAQVVLTGRAPAAERAQALRELGARVHYRQLDLTSRDEVADAVATLAREIGPLTGVLHCAGTIHDDFILKKSADQLKGVFGPKVAGTVNLDLATAGLDLDFFALFSSIAGAFGNPGQADYAAANGFMDGYADYRNGLVALGQRHGATVSIDWPLWAEGGMRPDAATEAALTQRTGMTPMTTADGLRAFHHALQLPAGRLLVAAGDVQRLRRTLLGAPAAVVQAAPQFAADVTAEQVEQFLRRQFAVVLKLAAEKIDPQAPLERYGIDSILAMDLTAQLESSFGSLPKTLFFEYQTIRELAAYFIASHGAKLAALCGAAAPAATSPVATAPAAPQPSRRPRRRGTPAAMPVPAAEPIAIVGLSGRYPQAPDVDAFWANLRDGKDCIVEVPAERWDWRDYYSEDRTAPGSHYSKWGGFIDGVDEFDPLFFGMPPADAGMIDPQERLFLQHAWMAVEDAGYTRAALQQVAGGQVGVYVGVMYGEYQLFGAEASLRGERIGVPVSYASIANRVSYLLNVHGPSMTLDTMCSSSMTAIHLACQDLKLGRTGVAIAGGVNVTIHPNKYLILSAGQFISGDGHCQSFGEGGDGYIPGEGVGAVVLKRLSDAVRDGNHIYGIIKGSALNHGGKTNGYSVPNPRAQGAVIEQALDDAGVDPRHVGYIEAHGTGTRLGDPIEIAALTQVFRRHTDARQYCAIGSVKSNVGHCESAAGMAGLTKVLLQMRHGMLVPSLHSAVLNPHIDFAASPFAVNQALRPWERIEVDGRPVPRIAGISSFGAGGSNAHLVIEEYRQERAPLRDSVPGGVIVPLSARTAQQLRQKALDLAAFLERGPVDLPALACTLQLGREAMDHRLAFVVDSVAQLAERLARYTQGDGGIDGCHQGQVRRDDEGLALLADDEDMAEAIGKWVMRRKLAKLADLWVKGVGFDWRALLGAERPAFISLPTYPFARERYWIGTGQAATAALPQAHALHPLLHANTSDFHAQGYTSEFTGREFFLADHRVGRAGEEPRRMLPGVACLEMARAAIDLALPADGPRRIGLANVAWTEPVVVQCPTRVALALAPAGDAIDFALHSAAASHCQGRIVLSGAQAPERLDLEAVRAGLSQGTMSGTALYDALRGLGLHYGPSMRCIVALERGDGQVLAELALPAGANIDPYVLHPALLDSALQAALALAPGGLPDQPAVPFALDALEVAAPCTARMFAWVREGAGSGEAVRKVDIDLCDADGTVCVRLRGLAARTLAPAQTGPALLLASPAWEAAGAPQAAAPAGRHVVLLCGDGLPAAEALQHELAGADVTRIALDGIAGVADRYRHAALGTFARLRALLQQARDERVLLQVAIGAAGTDAVLAGLSGLLDTARIEQPALTGQVVLVPPAIDAAALARQLRDAAGRPGDTLVRCVEGMQQVLRWQPRVAEADYPSALRNGGVYLITGGLGGLGLLFAREILTRAVDATVVLTGRAALQPEQRAMLDALAAELSVPAARLAYRQLDLGRRDDVAATVAAIVAEHGALHGVLHSAGMVRDGLLISKTSAAFGDVLAPKVDGTVNLDLATRGIALDFLVLFSSVASALGNTGQGDYAAANGFMDHYAEYRNTLVAGGTCHGKTLAIHWPLWADGGMRLDADSLELLTRASGMVPLATRSGMRALHGALAQGGGRVLVLEGDEQRLRRALAPRQAPATAAVQAEAPATGTPQLQAQAERFLADEFCALLGVPVHEVDAKAPLERYGMDSVLAMKLTNRLEQSFGSLSKTLFFEYQTIAKLAAHLVQAYPDVVRTKTGGAPVTTAVAPAAAAPIRLPIQARFAAPATVRDDDVAIVGVAGRYPQARDLAEFWDNLKNGRDSVTEIPAGRWDHARFYDARRNQPGKSYSKWGGFLDDVDCFDALFFNISPKEAELIDPQERLFLETVWEAIEDAGYGRDALAQPRVGVYVGAMWGQYELYSGAAGEVPSSSFASIANRVSYFFDFKGPSLALDTMCSSSLTALHLACEDVRKGTVDVAVAGGVNLSLHPNKYLSLAQGNFTSTDGRCRSFGAGGDGYVPGEGVGAVLVKPLRDALRDGDQVYAVIKGSAINHGGKTNGYTVPNPLAQAELIHDVLEHARIDPATIGYIETHGTGTSLGDPIEVTGLARAFDGRGATCAIGSVKSNIGHLESAAGIAAVTKVLLQFRYGQLAPSLHAEELNPHIDFASGPFHVQRALADWPRMDGSPRRAGVSSFGAGGSNAHLVLEEFVAVPAQQADGPALFVLSARNRATLARYALAMADFVAAAPAALADIAYTSQVGRTPMAERIAIVAADKPDLAHKLRQWAADGTAAEVVEGSLRDARQGSGALIDGDAGAAFVDMTLAQRDLAKLARLWTSGVSIDWALLHRDRQRRRISLPTYPFERERYWIDAIPVVAAAAAPAVQGDQLLCYRPTWQAAPASEGTGSAGPLLCIGGPAQVGALPAPAGRDEAALDAHIAQLAAAGTLPGTVLLMPEHDGDTAARLDRGLYTLHHLSKALLRHAPTAPVRIACMHRGDALHAALAAYLKTLAQEHPGYTWKTIALDNDDGVDAVLAAELAAPFYNEEVRYGAAGRQVRALEPLHLPQGGQPPLRHGGVYLVSGGLGGLGYLFSTMLCARYGARVVLTGRSPLDADGEAKLAALRAQGGDACYLQADIAGAEGARQAVAQATVRFGALHGVLHSAGVHHDAFIVNKTRKQMRQVLAAKVQGTLNLDLATADLDLDLFVLFSSVAGVAGNAGQCDYAYANAFLDGFAAERDAAVAAGTRHGRTLSIAWPYWQEGGMRLAPDDVALASRRTGLAPLPSDVGLRCWEALLQTDAAQGVVLYGDADRVKAYLTRDTRQASEPPVSVAEAPALVEATAAYLQEVLGQEIKLAADRIDTQERFDSFGVDSMMIGRMNARLEEDLGPLPKTLFYEHATIEALAAHLAASAPAALARHLGAAVPAEPPRQQPEPIAQPRAAQPPASGKVAIVGVHVRLPRSASLDEFWEHLRAGHDLVDTVPPSRWDAEALYEADPARAAQGRIYGKWGGFIDDVDQFDAAFFGIPADDARLIDPQERLFLQSVWAAFEDAGYTRDSLKKRHPRGASADVGVFAGVTTNTYHLLAEEDADGTEVARPGSLPWSIANRVSYVFDFQGPSIPVDTACSSSLVALQLACESLARQECQVAVAGGVNLYLHPSKYQSFCRRRMLAQDRACRSFGAGDDGFVPGEGVGAFVLKPLERAIADGDHVYGVIAAAATAHAGRSNGYSAPNPAAQASVIGAVLDQAGVPPQAIGYVEGHGTGTQLGDSLEVAALTQAFGQRHGAASRCALGSVKANVGHAESAAGVAAVAKVLLQLRHRELVPTLHSETPNPNIDFAHSPFTLQHRVAPWQAPDGEPRRALVNSFGAGGVNACLLLEEYAAPAPATSHGPQLIVLSARNRERLRECAAQLLAYVTAQPETDLGRLAYTLQVGREAMEERLAVVVHSAGQLIDALAGTTDAGVLTGRAEKRRKDDGSARALFDAGDLAALARLWVDGHVLDWDTWYGTAHPLRLPLPTYPFARERHWVSSTPRERAPARPPIARLHPLVSHNASTLREVSFASSLSAAEYYGRDHVVNGQPMFPGAGFLELAAVAGAVAGEETVTRIEDIVWAQPLLLGDTPRPVRTILKANGDNAEFVIVSFDEDDERVLHSEGRVGYGRISRHARTAAPMPVHQLAAAAGITVPAADFYARLAQAGLQYGPSFRTVTALHIGDGYALSALALDARLRDDLDQYMLHPCLIDGALQTVAGIAAVDDPGTPWLPFALDEVEILRPLTGTCYAHVAPAAGQQGQADIRRYEIRLLNESGELLVRLNNFCVRALRGAPQTHGGKVAAGR